MKGTPPAAVIYHATPRTAPRTYTAMMIHGGGGGDAGRGRERERERERERPSASY